MEVSATRMRARLAVVSLYDRVSAGSLKIGEKEMVDAVSWSFCHNPTTSPFPSVEIIHWYLKASPPGTCTSTTHEALAKTPGPDGSRKMRSRRYRKLLS